MSDFGNAITGMRELFLCELKLFAAGLAERIARHGEWNIRGFIDIFRNVYALSSDSKVLSKAMELQLLPELLSFAEITGYDIEPAEKQNWYPDFTFISRTNLVINPAAATLRI